MAIQKQCHPLSWLILSAILLLPSALAAAPFSPIQPTQEPWRVSGFVTDAQVENANIFQFDFTRDTNHPRAGTMWFATSDGLREYDGYRWKRHGQRPGGLPSDFIRCVLVTRAGELWVGTDRGAGLYDGKTYRTFGSETNLAGPGVRRIIEDSDGTLWFCSDPWPNASLGGGLTSYRNGQWRAYRTDTGFPSDYVVNFYRDGQGRQWVVTKEGLLERQGDRFVTRLQSDIEGVSFSSGTLAETPRHGLLFSSGAALYRYQNGQWAKLADNSPHQHGISAGSDGEIYSCISVATGRKAVARWTGRGWEQVSADFSVPHRYNEDVRPGPDGNIWVVGFELITAWRKNSQWQEYQGLPEPMLIDGQERIWFGSHREWIPEGRRPVFRDQSRWEKLDETYLDYALAADGSLWSWTSNTVTHRGQDSPKQYTAADTGIAMIDLGCAGIDGRFWMLGRDERQAWVVAEFSGGRWFSRPQPDLKGLLHRTRPSGTTGGFWCVMEEQSRSNQFALRLGDGLRQAVPIPGKMLSEFRSVLYAGRSGRELWLYGEAGLFRHEVGGNGWSAVTNLPGQAIAGVQERGDELWVAGNGTTGGGSGGLARREGSNWTVFPANVLFNFSQSRDQTLMLGGKGRVTLIPPGREAQPVEAMLPVNVPMEMVLKDAQGSYWLGNESVTFRFTPNQIPPETEFLNQDTNVLYGDSIRLVARAINRFRPHEVREDHAFSWRINRGEWSPFEKSGTRHISSRSLSTGPLVLEVRARNAGGGIDPTPAEFRMQIHPVPVQDRPWFSALLGGIILTITTLALVAVRARSKLAKYASSLEQKVAERTADLEKDLTERRRVEAALRESEQRWSFALEGAGDGVWDWNAVTNEVVFSKRWKEMLGYAEEEIQNNLSEWECRLHPDDKERVHEELRAHLEGRTPVYASEHRLRGKDGHYRWILDRGKIISWDEAGRPLRVIGTHTDIEERKRAEGALKVSEERLRHTLDSLLEGCHIIDFNWRYLYLNRLALEYSRKPAGELLGRTIMECYPGIEQTELFQSFRQAMEKRVVVVRRENLFHYPDGSSAVFDLEIHPVAEGIFIHSIDVTARHQAETAREKLAKIVEHSADFIAVADLHGKLTYLNPAGRRMIGVSEDDELSGLQFTDYVPDSWHKVFWEMIATTQQKGLWEGEMQLKHLRTGALIDVSRSVFLIRDPQTGQPLCYATVTRDITARKQAEYAFKESEERFSKAFHANPSIIAISTYPDGFYVDVNDAFTQVLEFTRDEVVGKRATDLGIWVNPDQRSRITQALERGEQVRGFETAIRSRSGNIRTLSASVERIELGGQPCLLFINHDITDWKQAEAASRENQARFQQLAENIQEVFWLSDVSKNTILYISPAYERIWGRTCASLSESPVSWVEALLPEDRERVLTAAREKQASGEYDIEYRIQRPDGSVRWIHDRAFPVRDAEGKVFRIAGVAEDITESRQLEAQFRQSQKMEALGTLSGGIAHDFNNILGAIFGNVHLAQLDLAENHPVAISLEEIEKAAERAKALVRQILAFSRQQPQTRQVGPLAPVITEATSLLRATLPADVELIKSIDTAAPNVLADPTQIHQILMNLCTNAWHALGDRPGRIEVQLRRVSVVAGGEPAVPGLRVGRYACLSVRDNGQGMDAATLERIFEPFFTTKAPGRGTGLGLSVVHGIVQSHDALLHVASKPGQGTTFQIFFPAIEAEPETAPPTATPWAVGNGERVLYLDDETALVDLAAKLMRKLGYEPETFTRPAAALEAVTADPNRFAVVITDLHMPAMNGLEFCRQVRKIRPDLPIILSSGYLTEEVLAQAHALGIYRLLPKPNTLRDFSEAIHEVLTNKPN